MANQPPPPPPSIRPWFRFGSLARPQAPQPAPSSPPQQPRRPPPVIRTPFGQTLRPAAIVLPTSTVQPAQPPSATIRQPSVATTQPSPPRPAPLRQPPSLLTTQQAPPPLPAARPPITTEPSPQPTDSTPTTQPTPPQPTVPAAPTPTTIGTIPRLSPATSLLQPSSPSHRGSPQLLSDRKLRESSPPKPSTAARASPSTSSEKSPSADSRSPFTHANYPSLTQIAPPRSPPTYSPPSPFRLPPQLMSSDEVPTIPSEEEPKRVLVQETTVGKPKLPFPSVGSTADGGFNGNHHGKSRTSGGDRDKKSRNHSGRTTIITLVGDNKGAVMQVGVRTERVSSHTGQRFESVSARTNRNRAPNDRLQNHRNYVTNSNVQGINNSILFNSSFIQHNPGVHFSYSRMPHHKIGFHSAKGATNQR